MINPTDSYYPEQETNSTIPGASILLELTARFYAARISGLAFNGDAYSTTRVAELARKDAEAVVKEVNR